MSSFKRTKINRLFSKAPYGIVLLSSWLKKQGYSYELIKRYKTSGWLEPIGDGAVVRAGEKVSYYGALYALQHQGNSHIHIGGRTALTILGKAHYLELSPQKLILFAPRGDKLPTWFLKHDWGIEVEYHSSEIFPPTLGLIDIPVKEFTVKISGQIRALMECLYLAPKNQELIECYELMESMNNILPQQAQELLENCGSFKVKRLFLFMAERIGHEWFKYLDLSNIDLGKGKRSIVKSGTFDSKYQITVPAILRRNYNE